MTEVHRALGMSHYDFFQQEFARKYPAWQILETSSTLDYVYLAIQTPKGSQPLICEIRWDNRYWYNFSYQIIREWEYPAARCPQKILRLLDDPRVLYVRAKRQMCAEKWRSKCLVYIQKRESKPAVKKGGFIVFEEPITFRDGTTHQVLQWTIGSTFIVNDKKYFIRKWRTNHQWHVTDDVA